MVCMASFCAIRPCRIACGSQGRQAERSSLLEAAGLCALKSWRKDDAKAEVLLAHVKDVRKVKGAAIGSVTVDEVERTLLVALDPSLEERLAAVFGAAKGEKPADVRQAVRRS